VTGGSLDLMAQGCHIPGAAATPTEIEIRVAPR
jgi:hypothetical protein